MEREIEEAINFALESPEPTLEEAGEWFMLSREITYAEALREAMREEMRKDPKVFLLGRYWDIRRSFWSNSKG